MIPLFEHQKTGIEFLKNTKRAILADEMGLGKSRQAIMAANDHEGGILVVCPASLKINWMREIFAVYPEAVVKIHDSGQNAQVARWHVINYDILEKKIDEILSLGIKTLILDEVHYIKGKSIRAACIVGGTAKKTVDGVEQRVKFEGIAGKMDRVYCLTGTLLLNRPIEMFNVLKAIGHDLGKKRTWFVQRYCGAFLQTIYGRGGYPIRIMNESGATNLDELREMIAGSFLRRKKADVLDLPPKIVSEMECELSPEWKKKYDTAWEAYLKFLAENPIEGKNIDNIIQARHLVEIQKLKQVCSQSKIDRIVSDIKNAIEQDEKVIVFSQYTETIKQLSAKLSEKRKGVEPVKHVTLTGADDMGERQKAIDLFQNDPETKVFVANIKAGGVGLTLTEASIVMFADMDWSPATHSQAMDRAHRIGQTQTVNAYFYIALGTIEEDILQILNDKERVIQAVIEGTADNVRRAGDSVFRELMGRIGKKAINRAK